MNFKAWIIIAAIIFVFACKKEKDKTTSTTTDTSNPVAKEEIVEISTTYGSMYVWLFDATPKHKANFLKLAKEGYYDGTTFHRIISGFMIQGGDPNSKDSDSTNDGTGGPGYTIDAEIRDSIKHVRGALAAARTNNPAKASSGSQFYICHSTSGTASLNNNYTVYGMVMQGLNVIDSVVIQPKNTANNRPFKDVKMQVKVLNKTKAEILSEYGYEAKL